MVKSPNLFLFRKIVFSVQISYHFHYYHGQFTLVRGPDTQKRGARHIVFDKLK